MNIEASGVVFAGDCEIQGPNCTARKGGALTAVWELPARRQVNVCRACLDEMIRAGEWTIQGARVMPHADAAVMGPDGRLSLVVEVKHAPPASVDRNSWAQRVRRNILAHSGLPNGRFFMLVAFPGASYLWSEEVSRVLDEPPTVSFDVSSEVQARLADQSSPSPAGLERAVAMWLQSVIERRTPAPNPFHSTGLMTALDGGRVLTQYSPLSSPSRP